MKYLKNFGSIMEAELAKNILKEHNVESWVQKKNENVSGDWADNWGADLFVNEKDVEEAKSLLEELNQ